MRPKDISMIAIIVLVWTGIGYFVYTAYFAKKPSTIPPVTDSATNSLKTLEITDETVKKINELDSHGEFPIKVDDKDKGTTNPFKAN